MASTYPLEVVEAERWAKRTRTSRRCAEGGGRQAAWEDSVKALVATPECSTMMSSKLAWTQKLGDAVLAQQTDVMDAVQRLRTKAQANNKLPRRRNRRSPSGARTASRSLSSSRPRRIRSTCPTTTRPWSTDHGPIRPIRHTTCRRPVHCRRFDRDWHRLRCGLRPRTLGLRRKLLGRRHEPGQQQHQRQPQRQSTHRQ